MLKYLPLWIILNGYAYLTDVLTLSGLWLLVSVWGMLGGVLRLIGCGALFAGVCFAVKLHVSYPMKKHLYRALYRRNRNGLHWDSFSGFVDLPCHRLIVRTVLAKLGHPACYREVMRRYYRWPWMRDGFQPSGVWFAEPPASSASEK